MGASGASNGVPGVYTFHQETSRRWKHVQVQICLLAHPMGSEGFEHDDLKTRMHSAILSLTQDANSQGNIATVYRRVQPRLWWNHPDKNPGRPMPASNFTTPCCVSCLPVKNKLTYIIVPWARLWLAKQSPANRRVIVGKQQAQTSRRGENRASVLSVLKKCRFRHSETADSFPKMVFKIPGILKWFFNDDL